MTRTSPTPRWLRILLVLSLALNLAVASLLVGFWLRGPVPPSGGTLGLDGFRSVFRAMAPEDQTALRQDLRTRRPEMRSARRELGRIRAEIHALLGSDAYSGQALAALLARQAEITGTLSATAQSALVTRIDAMPPERRKRFAARLEEHAKRPSGRTPREERPQRAD